MATGTSIHIGLNGVDPNAYGGWPGTLAGCENDARDMADIAKARGFEDPKVLLTADATSDAILNAVDEAAGRVASGDILLLTYSGHGGQVPDKNSDEDDRRDETWVAHDRQIVDDELYARWAKFPEGVRILVLSDSCHSGSVARAMPDFLSDDVLAGMGTQKALPVEVGDENYRENAATYDAVQQDNQAYDKVDIGASVLLISGCQDNQTSLDGDRNGLFTEKLRQVWDDGKFDHDYRIFHKQIVGLMPPTQTPNLFPAGAPNPDFVGQQPFAI